MAATPKRFARSCSVISHRRNSFTRRIAYERNINTWFIRDSACKRGPVLVTARRQRRPRFSIVIISVISSTAEDRIKELRRTCSRNRPRRYVRNRHRGVVENAGRRRPEGGLARVCGGAASPQSPEKGRGFQAHSAAGGDLAVAGKGYRRFRHDDMSNQPRAPGAERHSAGNKEARYEGSLTARSP